jgi:hypothetical protein
MKQATMSWKISGDRKLSSPLDTFRQGLAWLRGFVLFAAALMLLGSFCVPANAQTLAPSWYEQSPANNPGPRFESSLTYDAAHGQVVLFSGNDASNDTWLWNGTNWTRAQVSAASSPSSRTNPAMVYDPALGQVVLFGGTDNSTGIRLGDTWLWNGTTWTLASSTGPTGRNASAMVYDAATSQVLLFGGIDTSGTSQNDLWAWNGITWTQLIPSNSPGSPSARDDFGMAYDAARSEVVLFGGNDSSGNRNDTWLWNGSNWSQASPATVPPAREAPGMAYNAVLGQTVMFGGTTGGTNYLNDTWVWNGTNWTEGTTPSGLSGRIAPNDMTYDAALGQVILYSGISPDMDTWEWGLPANFGSVNVCPSGQTSPAPCSNTLALTYNVPGTDFGATKVLTLGASGLDFTLSGNTCTGPVSPGTCTVNVTFTPLAPGLRQGAVELFDSGGGLRAINQIYGNGEAPAVAFGPGTQTTLNTGTLATPKGLAVDATGNLYIGNTSSSTTPGSGSVVKVPAGGGTPIPLGGGFAYPQGLALDGAGDLFVADNNLNEVLEIPAGCTNSGCVQVLVPNATPIVGAPPAPRAELGVAVDGIGDVFFGDFGGSGTGGGYVAELPANSGIPTVVYYPASPILSNPVGLAVDAAGDLFIADYGRAAIVEVPVGCTVSSCQTTIGTGWSQVEGVAVDAAGDVFVTDLGLGNGGSVIEVPVGCNSSSCQVSVASGIQSLNAAVDATGNLFIADNINNRVVKVNRSQAPSLTFAPTNVGSTSTDSPQTVSVQNIGNLPLYPNPNYPTDFPEGAGSSNCANGNTVVAGGICTLTVDFTPQTGALSPGLQLNETILLDDNALNAASATQTVTLSGVGVQTAPTTVAVPNVVGQTQSAAGTALTNASLTLGSVTTAFSSTVPSGSVISQNPSAGTQAVVGSAVELLVSSGPQPTSNPLTLENNYFVTGDYVSAGVTLRGTGVSGTATGSITIPSSAQGGNQGVPPGADIVDAFLYWATVENTPSASGGSGTFDEFPITGQQIGTDVPYTDGALSGTLRVYRADVNAYFVAQGNGIRYASGTHTVTLPDAGGSTFPLTEGASLVVLYRVLSPNFPLKSVVIYDGSSVPTTSTPQAVEGFYDALGTSGAVENTNLFAAGGAWNNSTSSVTLPADASQYSTTLNPGSAYAAVIVSTPVTNSDNDGILDVWKTGPGAGDPNTGNPGYYDVKTGSWVPLPGAKKHEKDLFVQLDYMCGAVLSNGSCDPTQENLFPSPDASGNDPLAMVQQAFAANGVTLHLEVGNAVPEDICQDANQSQLCEFPNEPGVISWKNSLEFSKLWPKNFASCAAGGDCSIRFPYGQKDSYHYVLFGHSLAIPAWNTRYGSLTSISVVSGVTTIGTTDRGPGINACPSRITISGVLGNPSLNGVYNTTGCADTKTITVSTPSVPNWSYPNSTLPEPVIGLTSGTVTSISGYSDLGGSDSAVTLGLWLTAPNQDMSKRANVIAGTLFHEIGHTLGLSHGGLYYDTSGSYVPNFEANCKPNYQSSMNYLFQLDGVGPNLAVAYSNQQLDGGPPPAVLNQASFGSVTQLTDGSGNPATFSTSIWYTPIAPSSTTSPATLHCDGTPLTGDTGYRVDGPIAPITPAWSNGQNITFDGVPYTTLRGYNDVANLDLRQVGATGGEFASLASVLSFGSSSAPLNIAAGGTVALGRGGTVALGSGGTVTLGSGGNVTLSSGGTITLGSGGNVTLGSGGNVTLGSGGTVTPGASGTVALSIGGSVTLSSGGTITLGSGGNVTLGSGGTVTLGSGGTVTDSTGTTVVAAGGTYTFGSSGGTIALGSGGNVTLGSGGNVTLGSGGTIALGSGGTIALGSGGNITLGSGGTIALGSGGTIALGSGGNITLGSGGTIALGSGGNVTLGSGGNVTLGSGGTVTLGSGGDLSLGSGGNITLGSGGTATVGAGGTVTLGSGGNVTLGSGGNVTLSSGGTIALGSGGNITLGSGGTVTLGSGGTVTPSGGTPVTIGAGGTYTFGSSGGTIALGSGGNVTLGSGGNVTLGSGGTITLGSGGNVTLGSGGNVTLGSGGTIALGSGGTIALGSGGNIALGSGGTIALGSGGTIALGSGGNIALGSGGNVTLGSGGETTAELTYETANSIVRPPSSPTETSIPAGVRVDWTAPAFGVVRTYTIYRSVNGGTPIAIGSVSGVNGNPPATEFIDTNPDTTPGDVVAYTITTTLAPVTLDPTQRQSAPSPPAVMTIDQTITLGPLPSSVTLPGPQSVTATAMSSGLPNGLQVNFSATGNCAIGSLSVGPVSNGAGGVSSATVTLSGTGSCTISASQSGTNPSPMSTSPYYNAASAVSGIFTILPQGSSLTSQTINFATLPNVQYGNTFSLSATSSSGAAVSFTSSGPCSTSGTISGVGVCKITASAPASAPGASPSYSAVSVTQSFTIFPAVLKVTASNLTSAYGLPLPSLTPSLGVTYSLSGFVNGEATANPAVVSGAPALSTTATATSAAGNYPITVSTGTLSAANYSFLYVSGTLTIQPATATINISNLPTSAVYGGNFTPTYAYSGTGTPTESVASSTTGVCTVSGGGVSFIGAGTCTLTASAAATTDYAAVTGTMQGFTVNPATATIIISNLPSGAVYGGSFTPAYTYSGSGTPTESLTSSTTTICTVLSGVVKFVGVGTCTLTPSATATTDYAAVTGNMQSFAVNKATATIIISNLPSGAVYGGSFTPAYTYSGSGSPTESLTSSTTTICTVSSGVVKFVGAGTCTLTPSATATTDYGAVTGSMQSFAVKKAVLTVTANNASRAYGLANPTFTAAYNGYVNGDSFATAVTGSPSLTTAAVVTSLPGSYPIFASQGTLASAKYTFSFVSGTLIVAFTGSVPASSSACNGAYSGTFQGNLSVAGTQNCVFVGGGATGNITETGGNVVLGSATVGGNLIVSGGTFSIGPTTTIKGNFTVQSIPTGAAQNQICGTSVGGSLVLQSVGTAAVIGSGSTSCPGNTISGSLVLQANKAAIGLTGNTVDGSLTDQSNTASTTLSGNTVNGSLTDQGNAGASVVTLNLVKGNLIDQSNSASSVLSLNTVGANLTDQGNTAPTQVTSNKVTGILLCQSNSSITGSGNTASKKQGQCANF